MTYLSTPRLHFAGRFYADPPTVNNDWMAVRPGRRVATPRADGWPTDVIDAGVRTAVITARLEEVSPNRFRQVVVEVR